MMTVARDCAHAAEEHKHAHSIRQPPRCSAEGEFSALDSAQQRRLLQWRVCETLDVHMCGRQRMQAAISRMEDESVGGRPPRATHFVGGAPNFVDVAEDHLVDGPCNVLRGPMDGVTVSSGVLVSASTGCICHGTAQHALVVLPRDEAIKSRGGSAIKRLLVLARIEERRVQLALHVLCCGIGRIACSRGRWGFHAHAEDLAEL